MSKFALALIGAAAFLPPLAACASEINFDLRPGLWEITSQGETRGIPPIPADVLAKLMPDQRAKMEAAMTGGAARPRKSCVTRRNLEDSLTRFEHNKDQDCRYTVVTNKPHLVELHSECSGERQMTGDFHFEAPSREAMTGTVKMTMSNGANTMTSNHQITGRWLSDDCGALNNE